MPKYYYALLLLWVIYSILLYHHAFANWLIKVMLTRYLLINIIEQKFFRKLSAQLWIWSHLLGLDKLLNSFNYLPLKTGTLLNYEATAWWISSFFFRAGLYTSTAHLSRPLYWSTDTPFYHGHTFKCTVRSMLLLMPYWSPTRKPYFRFLTVASLNKIRVDFSLLCAICKL